MRRLLIGGVHLAVLWALAFQQPLFDLLGRNADFFVVRGNTRADILVFAFCFTLLPPLAMVAAEWLALRFRRGLYDALHLTFVAILLAAIVLQFLKDNVVTGPAGFLIVLALVLGAMGAWLYARAELPRQVLTVLSPAPLVFLGLFLLVSPVHKLILPQHAAAAADVKVGGDAPVVVLLFDELPVTSLMDGKGNVDAGRYPHFAELAKHSTWYRNTTTIASYTTRAVPALMSGEDPRSRLPIASDQPHSIFTLLGRSYAMNVAETATSVCPAKLCGGKDLEVGAGEAGRGGTRFRSRMRELASDLRIVSEHLLLPEGIARHLPAIDETFGGFGGGGEGVGNAGGVAVQQLEETVKPGAFTNRDATFERFVASLDGKSRTLNLIHIEIPHVPWVYLPTGQSYDTESPDLPLHHGQWAKSQYAVDYAYLRHLLQAGFADRQVGLLIERMKKTGLWDKAAVLVAADHGVSFIADRQRRDPTLETIGGIAPIPLFFRAPGQAGGRVDDRHRCSTDALGLIASAIRVEVPWPAYKCRDEVSVADFNGRPVKLPVGELLAKRRKVIAEMLRLFGQGDWARAYRFGPHPELIGRDVTTLPAGGAQSAAVALQGDFRSIDPRGGRVPVIVQGELTGVEDGTPLAVAVNGRIEVVAESFTYMGEHRLAATIPPTALRAGRNSVEVLAVVEKDGGTSLQPLRESGAPQ
jgi:hypothetical protein